MGTGRLDPGIGVEVGITVGSGVGVAVGVGVGVTVGVSVGDKVKGNTMTVLRLEIVIYTRLLTGFKVISRESAEVRPKAKQLKLFRVEGMMISAPLPVAG